MGKRSSDAKVAIIDDEPLQLEMMSHFLNNINITPDMFGCAEEFYQSTERFDLVSTDLNLSDDSGFDVCHFLKSKKETSDTFIMFVSAIDDSATITDAYSSGATGYLTKPIIPVEFLCQVQSILSQAFLSARLKNKSKQARSAAKSAMLESERLHHVIEFVRAASNVKHFSSMATLTFDLMAVLGFSGSIMFHVEEENHFFADDGKEHEFERKLKMEMRKKVNTDPNNQTRFFSSKGRTAASFSRCSLFLRSTPTSQEDSLLDFLGLFMNPRLSPSGSRKRHPAYPPQLCVGLECQTLTGERTISSGHFDNLYQ